jgi:DNA-binding response OmpR family regulator
MAAMHEGMSPGVPDQAARPLVGDASSVGPDRCVPSILVVDDDPEIRDIVRWLLEDEGWAVETASAGRDALDRATRARPALIVLDMGLPILSGEEVAMRLHDVYADPPPIIVVSADGRAGEKAARIGAASYLHKPFDVDVLVRLVQRTLASA